MPKKPASYGALAEALAGITAKQDEFYLSLGRFVAAFADTETSLQHAFWELAKVRPPIAQAVFSGVKTDAALNNIRRISEAKRWPPSKTNELDIIRTHFNAINDLRNHILHYGAEAVSWGTWRVTNSRIAHVKKKLFAWNINAATLDKARSDLNKLQFHILLLAWKRRLSWQRKLDVAEVMKQPWLYIPPPQPQPRRKNRKIAHKPPLPR